ncbi:MAG: hypothetical protein HUU09_12755, partial [Candidatus Jettenia caeni]|nr:hypothetical protein [Candidatus Jettenia caeni]
MKKIVFLFSLILLNLICLAPGYSTDDFRDFDVHYQLGNEYNKRGMIDDAIVEYKKAI